MTAIERALFDFLEIPPRPDAPPSVAGSVRTFRAARGYLYYSLLRWGFTQLLAFWGVFAGAMGVSFVPETPVRGLFGWVDAVWGVGWIGALITVIFLVQLLVTLLAVVLGYRLRWYMVTDRSVRVREGIVVLKEKTMSFANIQNLSVEQGPLQRLFGISDLVVESAGGGQASSREARKKGESMHQASFRGVTNAEEIRELIVSRLRRFEDSQTLEREAGLAENSASPTPQDEGDMPPALAAARELLAETRRLRQAVGP